MALNTKQKKSIVWAIVAMVIVAGGAIYYFKWLKPYFDKKREEKRVKETQIVADVQEQPTDNNVIAINEILKEDSLPLGFGGLAAA